MPSADTRGVARKARPTRRARPRPKARPAAKKAKPKRPAPKPVKVAAKPKATPKPKPAPPVRPARDELEEETVCSIEFLQDNRSFVARLDTIRSGMREHRAPSFMDLLELVAEDLREEFLDV
jgi:hypothetical protein